MQNHIQVSEQITTWFHTKYLSYSPAILVNEVARKFQSMCHARNLNFAVSPEQLRDSLSEATCIMYLAKRRNRDWAGPHRSFAWPSGWSNEYERFWGELLDSFLFQTEFWECLWASMHTGSCDKVIPEWKSNMELILPKYVLREIEILKQNGMILDSKILYIDETTQEPVYEEEEDVY
jgi:hypothetical protein